jgi:hypothetical protein
MKAGRTIYNGATLFMPPQLVGVFEHRSLRPAIPTRFATSAQIVASPREINQFSDNPIIPLPVFI